MSRLVVLKLGHGNWQQGLPTVIAQLWEAEGATPMQLTGSLPSALELANSYQQWRSLYEAFYHPLCGYHASTRSGIEIEEEGVTHVSRIKFDQLSQQLKHQLDDWLSASSFSKVEHRLRTKLSPLDEIRVIVETDDRQLRRFPWHLWSFFDDYPQAEVALSAPEYKQVSFSRLASANHVRILAVLGNSQGIDIQQDRILLEQLPYVETTFLIEPQRQALNQQLWDQQGWDIFFFAGHSTSQLDGELGEMVLNQTDSLTITHLKNALTAAIARGLKIAIFNSCDGLGLARDMADLNIPQLVVMREPVPDHVAQEFLKHLLTAFSTGRSFYQSVREAREKLQGLEDDYPCASWLPVICQNPAEIPIDWQSLLGKASSAIQESLKPEVATIQKTGRSQRWKNLQVSLATSILMTTIIMGIRFLGALQGIELKAFDTLMRQRPPEGPDSRILVVEVTEEDTNQHGYPIEDQTLATLIGKLERYSPRAIGIDMHRHQPQGQGRASLITQFQKYPNLFTVCSFGSQDINRAPPQEFSEAQQISQMGFSDLVVDDQDVIRRQLLSYDPSLAASPSACTTSYSLGFQLAFRYLYAAGIQPLNVNANQEWQFGSVAFQRLPPRFGGYQNLNGLSSEVLINYRSDLPGQRVTLQQVLQGAINQNFVKDRVILVGITAPIGRDTLNTPYGKMSGVWIHAHMVSQMLSAVLDRRPLIWTLPQWRGWQWGDLLWVFVWSSLGGLLGGWIRAWWLLGLINIIVIFVLYQICLAILIQGGWLPLIPSLISLLLTSSATKALLTDIRRQA